MSLNGNQKEPALVKALDELHFTREYTPEHDQYDIIILFGATAGGMRGRLLFAKTVCAKQLQNAKQIIFLAAERARFPDVETAEVIFDNKYDGKTPLPETEIDIAKYIAAEVMDADIMKKMVFSRVLI